MSGNTNSGTNKLTRRNFIQASAAAGAAALASRTGGLFAAGSDVVRIGIIGCGGQGTRDLVSCVKSSPGVEIAAMGDLFEDHLQQSLENLSKDVPSALKVPPDRRFVGFDAYKKLLQTDVQMVLLTTPPHWRAQHFQAAVEAGKHVFMEKPAGVDPKAIRSMIETGELARQKKLSVVAGTQRRHSRMYNEIIRRIHDGQIGDIVAGQGYWNGGDMLGYWQWYEKEGRSDMEWQCRSWPWFTWTSGDHIVEQHVHNLDVLNWAIGAHPVQCVGMGGRAVRTLGNIYDHFAVRYRYANGAILLSMARQINDTEPRVGEGIIGAKGRAYAGRIEGANAWKWEGPNPNPYEQEHADLIKSIRDGKPLNEGKHVAEATLTAIMGRMSAYSGKTVKWEFALKESELDLTPKEIKTGGYKLGPAPAMPSPARGNEELT